MRHSWHMAQRLDLDTLRPFTAAQAREAGLHHRILCSDAYRKMFTGVYIDASVPDTIVVRTRAALLVAPARATVSHATAARLWGATNVKDSRIHLAYTRDVHSRTDGILTHRFKEPFATCHRHGLPVTTPEQTFVHCAVGLDLVDLVALGDRLVKRGPDAVTTVEGLRTYAEMWHRQGGVNARRAAELVRPRVDSVSETFLRLLIVLAGLPEPVVNESLLHPDGSVRYRLDLSYPEQLLAIEYDGHWHETPEQVLHDNARRAELTTEGWRFEVVRSDDLYEAPEQTLERLRCAMRERDVPVPHALSHRWRRYFADHAAVA